MVTLHDVTERWRLEEERERYIGVLEAKNTEIEIKNAEMERFVYTVSHDLNSPLVTIRGFLGLMERDIARGNIERVERNCARIDRAAGKMARLLEELLQLSRVGRVVNTPEEVVLAELAREAAEQVAGRITDRGVRVEIDPDLPVVYGDRPRLLEVLQNLIDNAVKYMGGPGGAAGRGGLPPER